MASSDSDYEIGSMPVEAQSSTFSWFMNYTVYGGCLIAFILLYPILVFCTPLSWFPSLVMSAVIGIVLGLVFKLKGGWYAAIIGLSVFLALFTLFLIWLRSMAG